MRQLILIYFILIGFGQVTAQDSEGYVKYTIKVEVVDSTPELLQSVRLLRDSKMEIYFKPKRYRMHIKMGELYTITAIYNQDKAEILSLTTNMAGKFAQRVPSDSAALSIGGPLNGAETAVFRDSTKKIIGFDCYYVEAYNEGVTVSYWCTDQISPTVDGKSIIDPSITGFPLWFSKVDQGIRMTYIASNYRDEIENPGRMFSLDIPEGFQEVQSGN